MIFWCESPAVRSPRRVMVSSISARAEEEGWREGRDYLGGQPRREKVLRSLPGKEIIVDVARHSTLNTVHSLCHSGNIPPGLYSSSDTLRASSCLVLSTSLKLKEYISLINDRRRGVNFWHLQVSGVCKNRDRHLNAMSWLRSRLLPAGLGLAVCIVYALNTFVVRENGPYLPHLAGAFPHFLP